MAVRAAKLHEYLKKNGVMTVLLPGFNFRKITPYMFMNYLKLIFFILTKKGDDVVLLENERQPRLLNFFRLLSFKLALDIRDNRALQRSAYNLDDGPEKIATIKKNLLNNIQLSDYVFTVSQACKQLYPLEFHKKIYVIENASDPNLFEFFDLPKKPVVGFISGIAPGRGIELLIDAMKLVRRKVPNVLLSIAGTPAIDNKESDTYYKKLKDKFACEWITFSEDIYYSINASDFLRRCFLTVIPHPDHLYYHTTLPVKLFDYLASGRPVVATNCRETTHFLRTYECGLSADFNAEDFSEKIITLLADRALAKRLGSNGRKVIEEVYNWDNMAKKIIAIVSK
ncbi:MAG: glycosyltransferase family 4 protein [Deltaproteobacteria bacterium]|nr:glycosyltransferase family 4 protein [Deltaproteobacteria bacterium]